MIRKSTCKAQKPARPKLDGKALKALGEMARKQASELQFVPEWLRIKKSYSVPKLIDMVRASESKRGKGRPVSAKTLAWIERLRGQKRQGRGYLHLACEFRPDLPKESARAALRKFRSRWAPQIDS